MLARALSFVVWALVAFGCLAWGVRFGVPSRGVPPQAVPVGTAVEVAGDWSRLLGVPPPVATATAIVPEQSSRFKLAGVMAPRAKTSTASSSRAGQGVALISVDGKPPRAFVVGSRVDGDVRLQSVGLRMASLGPVGAGGQLVLELPPLAAATSSMLPAPAMAVPAVAIPTMPAPTQAYQPPTMPPQMQPMQSQMPPNFNNGRPSPSESQ